jgi:hypothetical protein
VLDEEDDRPGKVRVVQFRRSDEQMSGERTHQSLVEHGSGGEAITVAGDRPIVADAF